jgi:hypothetical protein
MARRGPHPPPPADLATRTLPVTKFRGPWFRVHPTTSGPLYFGKTRTNRFDAPGGEFGVLYLARHEAGAFIETFGHETGIRVLDMKELEGRALSRVEAARPLRLVDLRGKGLARLGADAELLTGAYKLSQAWALALHNHPAAVDGIAYRARHDPDQFCAAVFERAAPHVTAAHLGDFTADALAPLVAHLLDLYDFGLA